jgi:tetratricopeptide (TPR) repeat protein
LTLGGKAEYVRCHVSAAEALLERALVHAERAGDRRQLRTILEMLAKTNLDGPRPAADAISRLDELARWLPGDRALDAVMAITRAPLEAMSGRAQQARELYRRAQDTLEDLGRSLSLANGRFDSGTVELLAGDPRAAERELRWGFEALEAIGESGVLSSVAALLGQAVLAQGRTAEAERYGALSEELSAEEDVFGQVEWRALRAAVCARTGRPDQAERVAREAVELMEGTDALNLNAEAFVALGEALQAAGRFDEARAAFADAERLYERKGNVTSLARLRARSEVG